MDDSDHLETLFAFRSKGTFNSERAGEMWN